MKYIIDVEVEESLEASSKPRADIDRILEKAGWKRINIVSLKKKSIFRQIYMIFRLLWIFRFIKKEDLVLVQWRVTLLKPFSKYGFERLVSGKKILFLHDIDSLRHEETSFYERERFNRYDAIIAHTEKMKDWLLKRGIHTEIFVLGIFDYLLERTENRETRKEESTYRVAYAGNLSRSKSEFLYHDYEPDSYQLYLYGTGFSGSEGKNKLYQGTFKPDEIARKIVGEFGLVWDGSDLNECKGNYGNYLKYNCPHKMAMYMAAGLPVIIWSEAAMASFVKENGIGICIQSIYDIDVILKNFTDKEYQRLLINVRDHQCRITKGYYITKVMEKVEKYLEGGHN